MMNCFDANMGEKIIKKTGLLMLLSIYILLSSVVWTRAECPEGTWSTGDEINADAAYWDPYDPYMHWCEAPGQDCSNIEICQGTSVTFVVDAWDYDDLDPDGSGPLEPEPRLTTPDRDDLRYVWTGAEPQVPESNNGIAVFNQAGSFGVSCTIYDDVAECGVEDSPVTRQWAVKVRPRIPDCSTEENSFCSNITVGNGGGCSSCGGDDLPTPSLTGPFIYPPFNPPGGTGGPGTGDVDGGWNRCWQESAEILDTCEGRYLFVRTPCGCKAFPLPGTQPFMLKDTAITQSYEQDGSSTVTLTYPDGSKSFISVAAPSESKGFSSGKSAPFRILGADGDEVLYNRDSNGALTSVVMPNGDTWTYVPVSGSTRIEKVIAPDGTYVDIAYEGTGPDEGKIKTYTVNGDSNTTTTYGWSNGKLVSASRGTNRLVEYDHTIPGQITVTDKSITPNVVTIYQYNGSTTTVTVKDNATQNPQDRMTQYVIGTDNFGGKYIAQVIDPLLNSVTTNIDPATGRLNYTEDSSGRRTAYTYNGKGAVLTVKNYLSSSLLSEETYTYYLDASSADTVYVKTHTDIRGNYTHYYRNINTLWLVDEIAIAPAGEEPDWDAIPRHQSIKTLKKYQYWTESDPDGDFGIPGQLKREIVPEIEGSDPYVVLYKYSETAGGHKYNSPVETRNQAWNGSAYVDYSMPNITKTSYDAMGRVLSTTDGGNKTVWYLYDFLGRQTHTVYAFDDTNINGIVDPGETLTTYTQNHYDCCNMDWSMDEEGRTTWYEYDGLGRVTKTWTGISGQSSNTPLVQYGYNVFGDKVEVTTRSDASTARVTSYTYDLLGRVKSITYPKGPGGETLIGTEEFWYGSDGTLTFKRDGNGKVTAYEYDTPHGRLARIYYDYVTKYQAVYQSSPDLDNPALNSDIGVAYWPDVEYSYIEPTNLVQTVTQRSVVPRWENPSDDLAYKMSSGYDYDIQGRLSSYTPPKPSGHAAVTYTYNNLGQKTSITSGDYQVGYQYYANGWLEEVDRIEGSLLTMIASYTYDPVGNRDIVTYGNGATIDYDYDNDPRYRTTDITHKRGTEILAHFDYTERDKTGNPTKITDWVGQWEYDYDSNNRLIQALPPNFGTELNPARPVPEQPAGGDYGYDWVGNRLNPPSSPNPMVYNKADQLTLWPGMHSYTYYGDGSMNEVKNPAGTAVLRSYTYTPDGLLSTATYDGRTSTFTWDGDKNRVGMTMNGGNYSFVYDRTAGIPAVIEELTPTGPVFYIREPGGALIMRLTSSSIRYYHFDEIGSTRMLTDGSGNITDKFSYDAWGRLISHIKTADSVDQPYQYVGRLGYYSHHQDADFGLLQLGIRSYDVETGRFTQQDPLAGDSETSYGYSEGDPINKIDPKGLKCHKVNPNATGNYIGDCIATLKKCLPCGGGLALPGAIKITEFEVCDDTGGSNGDTLCNIRGTKCKIRIYPKNSSTDCGTVLHELLHAYWWHLIGDGDRPWDKIRGITSPDHDALNNAAHHAWDYYCDKKKMCYGKTPSKTDQLNIERWLGTRCWKYP